MKRMAILVTLVFILASSVQPIWATTFSGSSEQIFATAQKFYRTELYFGMNKPGGLVVTDEEWSKFLSGEVTSRFPEGFTVLDGYGQFKNAGGKIVKEKSRVLILLYPKKSLQSNEPKIEEIRSAYKKAFQQQSVLRMDISQTVRVSF